MIKANELRIGNKFKGNSGVETVLSLIDNTDKGRIKFHSEEHYRMYSHLILCNENGNQYKPFEIEGIPLTEEWLIKLGFKLVESGIKNKSMPYYAKDALLLFFNGSPPENTYLVGYGFTHEGEYYAATNRWISKVHELQNVYYEWKGTELTPKD